MKFLRLFKFKLALTFLVLVSCKTTNQNEIKELKPLITNIYTADPSAHIFNDKIYIYPSHDVDEGDAFDDLGSHFAMKDYHVYSMDDINYNLERKNILHDIEKQCVERNNSGINN